MEVLIVIIATLLLASFAGRALLARRGSGQLAQVAFRRAHGRRVAALLGGDVDPRPNSPWIAFPFDGRPARLAAARVAGRMQAGVELAEHEVPVNIWLTSGEVDELEIPDRIDVDAVLAIVERLAAAEVDSVCAPAPIEQAHGLPRILRLRFDDIEELPGRLEAAAALVRELEAL